MKTIIWKELRETWKWAALAFLFLAFAEVYALTVAGTDPGHSDTDLTLYGPTCSLVSALGCSVVGAILGALQILPELGRDRWAALLHRPVSRQALFLGKVIGGLVLYLGATGGALLISVLYLASPGNFAAPFVPGMALPALTHVFLGMSFYFAALLISLSRGTWWGLRALLALAPVGILLIQMNSEQMFVLPVCASLVLMIAACGAMNSNALPRSRGLSRCAVVLIVLAAACVLMAFLEVGLSTLPSGKDQAPVEHRDYVLTADGNIVTMLSGEDGNLRITSLDGKPVEKPGALNYFDGISVSLGNSEDRYVIEKHPKDLRNYVVVVNWQDEGPENWYLLAAKGYLVGYDKMSKRCIGICDREGFHAANAVPKPFARGFRLEVTLASRAPWLFWAGNQLYGIDLADRKLEELANYGGEAIYGSSLVRAGMGVWPLFVVASNNGFRVLDLRSKAMTTIPFSHNPRIWSIISLAATSTADRLFVQYQTDLSNPKTVVVDEVDLRGNTLRSYTLEGRRMPAFEGRWQDKLLNYFIPPALAIPIDIESVLMSESHDYASVGIEAAAHAVEAESVIIPYLMGGILGLCSWVWARGSGFAEKTAWKWAVFVAVFGLPGLLTFYLAADWPMRVRCPKCGRKRLIEAEQCGECRAPWDEPAPSGAEIFDGYATQRASQRVQPLVAGEC